MSEWADRYWTSSDGLQLHYRDYDGPADRPPIVMLHGLTRNARDFEELADRYAGAWRVIVPDFRGRGLSAYDPDPSHYQPPVYARDILQLLDELGIDRAVFVVTSLGGLVTMLIATMAPERVAAVVLNDIGPVIDEAGLDRIRSYVGVPGRFRDWDDAVARLRARHAEVHPRYDDAAWLRYAKRVARETDEGVEFDYDMAIAEPFKAANEQLTDAWPFFRSLAGRPLVLLRGETSDLLSQETAEKMVAAIPGARLVVVPGVGHAPDLGEPEVIEAIDDLLEQVLKER